MIVEVEGTPPTRATPGSAGYDLESGHFQSFPPGSSRKITVNLKEAIPEGFFGLIAARSSLYGSHGLVLANSIGVADPDYRGFLKLHLINTTRDYVAVKRGDRLAQIIYVPYVSPTFIEADLDETSRGDGGFGSTGTN